MRNDFLHRPVFLFRVPFFLFVFLLFFTAFLTAQTTIEYSLTNGDSVTIITDISTEPLMDTKNGESSIGFFYRIDSDPANNSDNFSGNEGSYYWRADIKYPATSIKKTIKLPQGKYSLVAYQSRKTRPIKSLTINKPVTTNTFIVPVPVSGSLGVNSFAGIIMGTGSSVPKIKIRNSWNTFTDDDANVLQPVNHYTTTQQTVQAGNQPWLFITLSAQDWTRPATIEYNHDFFEFDDAIIENDAYSTVKSLWVSAVDLPTVDQSNPPPHRGELRIKPSAAVPKNNSGQTHVHLIFKVKTDPPVLDSVKFIAHLEGYTLADTMLLAVKPKPHDPNNLTVSKKSICPCTPPKVLRYRVEFQNIGNGPVQDVRIEFHSATGLKMNTLKIGTPVTNNFAAYQGRTYKNNVPVTFRGPSFFYRKSGFFINGINLPGTHQKGIDEDDTWDYIEFEIETMNCLKDGTIIQPFARVYFSGVPGYLDTNLGQTQVLFSEGESTDAAPIPCTIMNQACNNCMIKPVESEVKTKN